MPSVEIPKVLDGDVVRDMNETELAQYQLDAQEWLANKQAEIDRAALKAATIAKLGLSTDEIAALFS